MKAFRIKTTGARDAFAKIFFILRDTIGIRDSAIRILADLSYFNWRYRDVAEAKRGKLIMSYEVRQYIQDKHKITQQYLNNQISYLRKEKILVGDMIKKEYRIDPKDYLDILFIIDIQDEKDRRSVLDKS